jgi:ubiquinone/menaquinone biosynthesis C-methylase UbiE
MSSEKAFTPALGRLAPARFFDLAAVATRERRWRALVVRYASPGPNDLIVDVGCGTGSLALLFRRRQPGARVIGVDPDERMIASARRKAQDAGLSLELRIGMGDELATVVETGEVDLVVSSLVLHQCPMHMKRAILASMAEVLRPGGRLVIADYGRQRTRLMRTAFRIVQLADGVADTQPNADGVLPKLISSAGFRDVLEVEAVSTLTGSISVYTAKRV